MVRESIAVYCQRLIMRGVGLGRAWSKSGRKKPVLQLLEEENVTGGGAADDIIDLIWQDPTLLRRMASVAETQIKSANGRLGARALAEDVCRNIMQALPHLMRSEDTRAETSAKRQESDRAGSRRHR